jgi:integrase
MLNINNYLRSYTEKTPQRIWAVFYLDGKICKINTNQSIKPSDWSKTSQKAKQNEKLNKLLKEQAEFIEDYIEKLKLKKKRFYKDELQSDFNNHFKIGENRPKSEDSVVDFISFIEKYLVNSKHLSDGTHRNMGTTLRHLTYCFNLAPASDIKKWKEMSKKEKMDNPDFIKPSKQIDFEEINYKWFQFFHTYFLKATYSEKKNGTTIIVPYSKNFIAKQIKNLKTLASEAIKEGYIHNLSFLSFQESYEEADNIHLSWSEIEKLKALKLDKNTTIGKVRNLFVLNCYLGLRYSDLNKLDGTKFITFKDKMYLKLRMKKTDGTLKFPVLESAEKILKMYNYVLPTVCDPIFNEEIKKVCLKAGIASLQTKRTTRGGKKIIETIPKYKMVSSHTGRRSFATNFFEDGAPMDELMAVTGHTSETTFKSYVKSKKETEFKGFLAIGANR